jgi:hypothetical protein
VTSRGASVENRAMIEGIEHEAKRRCHPDRFRIDESWHAGTMPDIRSEVAYLKYAPTATFARVRVQNMDGLPVVYKREFVFVKNRFLVTRAIAAFDIGG